MSCDDPYTYFPSEDVCAEQGENDTQEIPTGLGAKAQLQTYLLDMDDTEADLFDCWATELVEIAGTKIDYYVLDLESSVRDPLYDEPEDTVWRGPIEIQAQVRWEGLEASAREEGFVVDMRPRVWIARKTIETHELPTPKAGDVVRFWKVPFWDSIAQANSEVENEGLGLYFNVQNADPDGTFFDEPNFAGFELTLHRETSFTPERRIQDR